ncbi:MAG: glycosyltransferase family 9 protein [Candidatus Aminicenantes bacterium]|nr:glycosyltransferase family 9 protein [Candidatus Aminicenantes bacterium]
MTTPAVAALKAAFPDSSLTYVVEKPFARLVQGHPHIDHVIVLDPKPRRREFPALIRKIRREKFDAVLDFHGGPKASLLAFLSGARIRVGYAVKYRRFIYNRRIPRAYAEGPVHSALNHLNLVKALGAQVPKDPPLTLPEATAAEKKNVQRLMRETGRGKRVVLHIGAGNRFRDWGVENISRFIGLIGGLRGVRIVLVGGREDREAEEEIQRRSGGRVSSFVGRVNLIELREVIRRAALFIGPDSGPMHIAASTPTPIVAVFGPTLPAHFAPWKARAVIVQKDLDCRPCRQRKCVTGDYRCLRDITPEQVFKACRRFLR